MDKKKIFLDQCKECHRIRRHREWLELTPIQRMKAEIEFEVTYIDCVCFDCGMAESPSLSQTPAYAVL